MNPSTARALDRLLRKMERPRRARRGGFSTAPIVLGLALVLAYQLLTRLVPMVWGQMLPGGLDQADQFRGLPGLVWLAALRCHYQFRGAVLMMGGLAAAGLFVSLFLRPLRFLVWLAAVGMIVVDAGIVYVTLRMSLETTARAAGLG